METSIETRNKGLREHIRIVWAITVKDVADAIKNKTTLTSLAVVLFMIAFYRLMPVLESQADGPYVLAFDAGESSLIEPMEGSLRLNLYTYSSQEKMIRALSEDASLELGLVIPADFDQRLASGQDLELDGYVLHWVNDQDAAELQSLVEEEIAAVVGRPVRINLEGHAVYPQKDSTGFAFTTTMSVLFATVILGITLIPNLMIEEKKTRTMDALLVSPATAGHIVAGKAFTGVFYGLTSVALVLAVNAALITHWPLAILASLCGVLFAVAMGLLLGSAVENRMQLNLAGWVVMIPLLIPVFLSIMSDLLPAAAISVMNWIPTVALSKILRVSFAARAPLADFGPELALITGCTALVLVAVVWIVRRSDR